MNPFLFVDICINEAKALGVELLLLPLESRSRKCKRNRGEKASFQRNIHDEERRILKYTLVLVHASF